MKYKKIEIDWEDITLYAGQYTESRVKEYGFKRIKTIGYLIEETKKHLKISMGVETTEEENIIDFLVIPKSNIIKKRFIK